MEDTEDMWIGSNVDQVGDFDDLVLSKWTTEGKHIVYLIQLKHQENPKNIARHDFTYSTINKGKKNKSKQDFSLFKYSAGFRDLKCKLEAKTTEIDETEVIRCLRKADKVVFVLYTNKGVDNCEFLECVTDSSLAFLNTGGAQQFSYSFDHTKLAHDSDFLQQLLLFCNQAHVSQTDNLIKNEIKRILGSSKVSNVDFEEATNTFVEFVKAWARGVPINKQGNLKVCYTLKKCDVINVLSDILLKPYTLNFSKDSLVSYDCPEKEVWNEMVRDVGVTVVDFDEGALAFLKEYIGGEVGRYCEEAKTTWMDHLSKTAVEVFYQNHSNLNNQILRITESERKLTMFDLYQNLWFNKKLPLLLLINETKDFNDILRILKISNYNLRVIIINKSDSVVAITTKLAPSRFLTLRDLNVGNREELLGHSVKLQGRSSVLLKDLIDESMYEHFNCNDIINILSNNFSIGSEYEPLDEYFIPRSLFKIFLKPSVLSSVKDELFLVQPENNLDNKFSDFALTHKSNNNLIFISKETQKLELTGKVFHRLIFHDENSLEWKESHGGAGNIRGYQDNPNTTPNVWDPLEKTIDDDASCSLSATLRVISAPPGMGKSTALCYIAHCAPTNFWVLKINLLDHDDYYKSQKSKTVKLAANHLEYFNNNKKRKLDQAIFEKFLKTKRVLVLLDGFDEISISYKDEVTQIAKCLHEGGFPVWLTTRPHMKTHLEVQLNTISTTLKPFTAEDHGHFLYKYFTKLAETFENPQNHTTIIKEFILKLLLAAKQNLSDSDSEFTVAPLQTKLLADVLSDELRTSLKTGTVRFKRTFNLVYLYENFLNRKSEILCEKFGKAAEQTRILFREHQQLFALKTVFVKENLWDLNIDLKLDKYYKNTHQLQFLQQEGIIVIEENDLWEKRFNFVHRTLAEYSAAQWLSEHYDSDCAVAKRTARKLLLRRFDNDDPYKFLFRIFDCILAKNCPLHMLIINGQVESAKKRIRANPDLLDLTDEGGRTVLHLIPLYGLPLDEYDFVLKHYTSLDDHMTSIIQEIPNHKITNLKDKVLNRSALDYALANDSLVIASKLCAKSPNLTISTALNANFVCYLETNLDFCFTAGATSLLKKLLPHLICEQLLNSKHRIVKNQKITSYCKYFNLYHQLYEKLRGFCLLEMNDPTILELLQAMNIAECTELDYYNDLRFAVAFGTEDNVLQLLSSVSTLVDVFGNTPLHYAVLKQRSEMVKLLLTHGADVNRPDAKDNTPLHCSARNGSTAIMKMLLGNEPEINKLNDLGESPLRIAVQNDNLELVKLLLGHGADPNQPDIFNNAPIHIAAKRNNPNAVGIVKELLVKKCDVNKQNYDGKTPLNIALRHHNKQVVKLLHSSGANCNIQDCEGNYPLHVAAECCAFGAIGDILSKTIDRAINALNNNNETPLHLSMCYKGAPRWRPDEQTEYQLKTVEHILNNGADVNLQDINGNTALHNAIIRRSDMNFKNSATLLLLNNGADMNLLNKNGESALDLAITFKNTEIASLIQRKIANPTKLLINESETHSNNHCVLS